MSEAAPNEQTSSSLLRWILRLSLAAFLFVVTLSFSYGLYLLVETARSDRLPGGALAGPSSGSLTEQLREAERRLEQGDVEQALVGYRRILGESASVEAQLGVAQAELLAGREDVAAREFEKALELDGENAAALLALGRLYSKKPGTWHKAEDRFSRYLDVRPGDADARLGLARTLAGQGKHARAADQFSRPDLQARMSFADRRSHALALNASGRAREAQTVIKKLLAAQPDDDLRLQLAHAYAACGEWAEAVPLYELLARKRPGNARLQYHYGQGLAALGNATAAREPLGTAARALPDDREVGLAHARALKEAHDLDAAAREYARIVPGYEQDPAILREYADLLMEKRDYGEAARYYRAVMELGTRDVRLLLSLAGAYQARGRPREAVPLLEEVRARQPTDRVTFDLARLYQEVGRNEEALALLAELEERR